MTKGSNKRAKNAPPTPPPPPAAVAVSPDSPSVSNSSSGEDASDGDDLHPEETCGPLASRPSSPSQSQPNAEDEIEDAITCQWEECGIVFTHLPTLIDHIHNEHIGVHKSNYTCEWATCLRRGLPQTSRFALISHIRSHTGEKPFICPLPECDKSFTRSDALAKHMRLQHNISPPAPGRGGSRKRKRAADDQTQGTSTPVASVVVSPHPTLPNATGFMKFKVEAQTPSEVVDDGNEYFSTKGKSGAANGRPKRQSRASQLQGQNTPLEEEEEEGYSSSSSDALPPSLRSQLDESTGLVMGRTPAKIMYLLMKAKHKFAMEQHEELQEQLRILKNDMQTEKDIKEGTLDDYLRRMLGPEAEVLMAHEPY
ncbi:hypothetical protein BDN70DRAFT_952425 [Pholiota conissans]|uniref:C2H2-type domain-containing protein n=1 Tax=Pholiota conissans TaxID=109636 RepID=A0A9P5YUN0_9AGAR|nr:hypothetical protein BDN70DRAFT_952425 [Pholiota conissans]